MIEAQAILWKELGQNEISVRIVARQAKASVSAIDYHFGSLEQLFVTAQKASLRSASDWMEGVLGELEDIGGTAFPVSAQASLVASIIDDWVWHQRPLALAWREAQAAAFGGKRTLQPHLDWTALWQDFWATACVHLGLTDSAELLACYFDGEANQHLIRWRRQSDRALLDETARALLDFLAHGNTTPGSAVRDAYQQRADAEYAQSAIAHEVFTPLDEAAASLLADEGLSALTFRAVAKRAGTTLGTIAYHFGSKADLAQRALRSLYETSAEQPVFDLIEAFPESPETLADQVIESVITGEASVLRAIDEIALSLSRGGDHGAFSAVIRAFRDPIGVFVLGRLLGGSEMPSPSLVAAFSSIVRGFEHASTAVPERDRKALGQLVLSRFVAP